MIEVIGRTLRLVFGRVALSPNPIDPFLPVPATPEIAFSAYAEDCRLSGHLRLATERLSDMLNSVDELVLVDVLVESLIDGHTFEAKELLVARDELVAVEASGPRGNPQRRIRVRPFPIGVKLGPYLVRGYVHVSPGANPLVAVRRKRPMVALTEATIEYQSHGSQVQRRSSTILFNRLLVDWIAPTVDEAIEYPDLPISKDQGPLMKDFTGSILLDR